MHSDVQRTRYPPFPSFICGKFADAVEGALVEEGLGVVDGADGPSNVWRRATEPLVHPGTFPQAVHLTCPLKWFSDWLLKCCIGAWLGSPCSLYSDMGYYYCRFSSNMIGRQDQSSKVVNHHLLVGSFKKRADDIGMEERGAGAFLCAINCSV